jgi:hypothetical protein
MLNITVSNNKRVLFQVITMSALSAAPPRSDEPKIKKSAHQLSQQRGTIRPNDSSASFFAEHGIGPGTY